MHNKAIFSKQIHTRNRYRTLVMISGHFGGILVQAKQIIVRSFRLSVMSDIFKQVWKSTVLFALKVHGVARRVKKIDALGL